MFVENTNVSILTVLAPKMKLLLRTADYAGNGRSHLHTTQQRCPGDAWQFHQCRDHSLAALRDKSVNFTAL